MFDGEGVGAGGESEDGWRLWLEEGDEGRDVGGEGCERNARCAWRVGVRRVVASPERWRDGRCSRE